MANEADFSTEARNFLENNMIEQSQMQLELLRRHQLSNSFNYVSTINQQKSQISNFGNENCTAGSNFISNNVGSSSSNVGTSNIISSLSNSNGSVGSSFSDNSQEGSSHMNPSLETHQQTNNSIIAAMIEEVKNYPSIWNVSSTDFKDRSKKEESWKRIGAQLRSDGKLRFISFFTAQLFFFF